MKLPNFLISVIFHNGLNLRWHFQFYLELFHNYNKHKYYGRYHIYLPIKNGGILTLFWAFYSIASFVYYLRKGRARMVYISLGLIIFVAAKLIILDLNTLNILSKVITSLVFGAALLLLSYAIQPMLKKFGKPEIEKTEES